MPLTSGRSRLAPLALIVVGALLVRAHAAAAPKEERKAFDSLRDAVVSRGGYVHPSLGVIAPAPSGAPRGLGIVKKIASIENDVLLRIPISYQMTRNLALSTLTALIPVDVLQSFPLTDLDDAALLVLLLAHEKGLGKKSEFRAFVDGLPEDAGCGWADVDDFRKLPEAVGPEDVETAVRYAYRVSTGMAADYGSYLAQAAWPKEWKEDVSLALRWALCTVNSRGTAANSIPGNPEGGTGVRLVPLADLGNHDYLSAGFIELSGKEKVANGDFADALETDAGTFVVRSSWKDWRSRELDVGDEVTVNYNLPHFGAVDWFLSLGFVPPEALARGSGEL